VLHTLAPVLGVQRPKNRKNPPLPTIGPVVPGVPHLSASLFCILDTLPNPVIVNGSRLDLAYVHPGVIDPCQSWHGRLVPRTRSSHDFAAGTVANFGFKSGTRIIELPVSSIPKFAHRSRQTL